MDPWPDDSPEDVKDDIFDIAVDFKDDFEIVDVNEEDLDNISEKLVDHKLEATPIVYTTRLNDMLIFIQRTVNMSVDEITNRIIEESKPTFTSVIKKVDSVRKQNSFTALRRKISRIYGKRVEKGNVTDAKSRVIEKNSSPKPQRVQSDILPITERNNKLLKMCKPLRVIVTDFRKYPYESTAIDHVSDLSSTDSADECPLSSIKRTAMSLTKLVTKPSTRERLQPSNLKSSPTAKITYDARKINFNGSVIMKNQYCNETDIYFVENGNVIQYNTHHGLSEQKPNDKTIVLKFCCWQKRDDFITCSRATLFNESTKFVVRKTHDCLNSSNCRCCCRSIKIASKTKTLNEPGSEGSDATDNQLNLPDNIEMELKNEISDALLGGPQNKHYGYDLDWRQDLLSTADDDEKFVNKAFLYTRPSKTSDNNTKLYVDLELPTLLQYKVPLKGTESYQIDPKRNITTYVNGSSLNTGTGIVNNLCCWFKGNELSQTKDISHCLSRILKSKHECPPGDCSCCCKDVKKNSGTKSNTNKLTEVMTTRRLKNVKFDKKMKTTASRNQKPKLGVHNDTTGLAEQNIQATTQKQNDHTKQPIRVVNPQKKRPRNIKISTLPDTNSSSKFTTPSKVSPPSTAFTSAKTNNVAMNKDNSNKTTDSNLSVDSMISTILDRFKDVRLSINSDGKIAAELHTPVSTLTTAELKVLANILAHAQEQVKALGLAPGTCLNFTNTVSTATNEEVGTTAPTAVKSSLQRVSQDFTQTAMRTSDNFVSEFQSFVNNSMNARMSVPKIANVFSLKDVIEHVEEDNKKSPSSGSSWYKKPEESDEGSSDIIDMPNPVEMLPDISKNKRKSEAEPAPTPQKIRVVDPSKLGISESSSDPLITGVNNATLIGNPQQEVMYVNSLQGNSNLGFVVDPRHIKQTPPLVNFNGISASSLKFLQATIIPGNSNVQNPVIINNELNNVNPIQVVAPMQNARIPVQSSVFHIADPKIAARTNQLKLVPVSKTDPPRLSKRPQPQKSIINNVKIAPAPSNRVVTCNPHKQSKNLPKIVEGTVTNDNAVISELNTRTEITETIINLDDDC